MEGQQTVTNREQGGRSFAQMVVALVLPMALQNLINVAVTSADVIMLGWVGTEVLSGASLAGQVQFIMTLIFFGLTSGAAVLTAQYWGKGDTRTIEKVMGIALRFSLIVAAVFFLVAESAPELTMRLFTGDEAVIKQGAVYLRIVAPSYLFSSVTMVYLNIMRSVERVMVSMVVFFISLLANIGLNALFIFGLFGLPAMGIAGAALATACARLIELILVLLYARWMKTSPCIHKRVCLRFSDLFVRDPLLFGDFMRYSLPVIANELMWGLGTSMSAVVIGHLSTQMVAANAVAQVARQLATVVSFGIANAAAILIGKAIGEGRCDLAADYARRFIRLTLAAGGCGSAIILAVRPFLVAGLSLDAEARKLLSMMLLVMAYFVFAQAYNTTQVVGIFRAGGDTRFGLILDVSTMWGGSILVASLAAFLFQGSATLVYILLLSDELIKIPFTTWRYRTKKWLRNVTRGEEGRQSGDEAAYQYDGVDGLGTRSAPHEDVTS